MRVLITGGAGFIGSHLADAFWSAGTRSSSSTTSPREASTTSAISARIRVPLHDRERPPRADGRRAGRPVRRRLPPGRGGRRPPDRREPGPDDRDQRARHRGRAGAGQQEEEEGPDRVDLRGLRAERPGPVPRGRQPGAGPDLQGALELRVLEGDRRVPGAGLLARAEAAHGHRPAVQHGRPAADRAIRHGRADVRQAGAHRPADHDLTATAASRAASPTSTDVVGALVEADGSSGGGRRGLQHRLERGSDDPRAGRAGQGADGLATPRSSASRTSKPTARASRTCRGGCPTSARSAR